MFPVHSNYNLRAVPTCKESSLQMESVLHVQAETAFSIILACGEVVVPISAILNFHTHINIGYFKLYIVHSIF